MTQLFKFIVSIVLVIFTSATNKIFGYIGFPTYLYTFPIIILILIPNRIRFNLKIALLITIYFVVIIYSLLFGMLETKLIIDLNILRIIIVSILILKYSQYFSYEKILKWSLILNLTFLYYCFAFKFDFLAIERGVDSRFVTRFGGFGINPNIEGYILVLLFIGIVRMDKRNMYRYLPFVLGGLIITFSYTSILAIILYLIIESRKTLLLQIIPFILIILLLVQYTELDFFLGHSNSEKLSYLFDFIETGEGLNSLTTNRLELFYLGLQHLFSEPIIGHGLGHAANEIHLGGDVGVHNSFLEILIDHGIPLGGLILLTFLYVLPSQVVFPVLLMASAGHGFFYDVNFSTTIILIIVYETISKRRVGAKGLLSIEREKRIPFTQC